MSFVSITSIDSDASATDTLVTGAFVTANSNRHIDVHVGMRKSGGDLTVSSITRTDTTFTHQRTDNNQSGTVWHTGAFWMTTAEPATASAAATIVISESVNSWGATFTVLDDVDQTTRIRGGSVTLNPDGDGAVGALAMSSATDDLIVSSISGSAGDSPTTATGGTETDRGSWNTGADEAWGLVATAPGGSSVDLDWDGALFRWVHYAVSHPSGSNPPVLTLPTGYIATNNLAETTISGISVAEGDSPVTLITFTCTSGKGVFTATGSGSTTVSGNSTNSMSLLNGSETDMNNALATVAFQGTAPTQEKVTLAVLATDGTLNDSGNIVVFNDVRSLSVTADSYADAVACIQTLFARLPAGETTDTITITATDEDTLPDEQVITLFVPQSTNDGGIGAGGGGGGSAAKLDAYVQIG